MGFKMKKLKDANKAQKCIFTVWLILSIIGGYQWVLSEQSFGHDVSSAIGESFSRIPFVMILLGIPAFILFKVWSGERKEK